MFLTLTTLELPPSSESLPRQASRSASVTVAEREFVIRYSCLIVAREPFKSVTRGEERRTRDSSLGRHEGTDQLTRPLLLLS